eukprot:scaffold250597_cov32-Prasinocladus_malaysianus.AAC.2
MTESVVALGKYVDKLDWARASKCPRDSSTCALAAFGGQLEIGCIYGTRQWPLLQPAAEGGHLGVIQWFIANDCPWDESACSAAAEGSMSPEGAELVRGEWLPV